MYSPYSEYENEAEVQPFSLNTKKDVSNPYYPIKTEFNDFVIE